MAVNGKFIDTICRTYPSDFLFQDFLPIFPSMSSEKHLEYRERAIPMKSNIVVCNGLYCHKKARKAEMKPWQLVLECSYF